MEYIVIISALLACICSSIKFIHIFQLNSYAHDTQYRWMKHNLSKLMLNIVYGLASLVIFFTYPNASAAVLIWAAFHNRYKKAKKPIAFTARVKRLLTTVILVSVIPTVVALIFGAFASAIVSIVMYLANPIVIILSDTINAPIEKAVRNYYINDAKKILSASNADVIGVTGSFGKTSVKYYLNTLLNSAFDTLMTPESYNTPMGVVITIRNKLTARHKHFICEMGARRVGDIKEICDIVHPDMGIITSVGPQHLETFGDINAVIGTKFELADALKDGSPLFVNLDNEYIRKTVDKYKNTRRVITYGGLPEADYRFETVSVSSRGTEFKVISKDFTHTYQTKLIGEHNVLNITGAIAVASTLGIKPEKLALAVRRLECVPHRLELTDNGSAIIIDDAYNSNPTGAKAALDALSLFEEYKVLVTPGMVELGDKQYELNREFGRQAAEVCDYIILVGRAQAEPILDGMGTFPKEKYYVAENINDAISHAYGLVTDTKKVILLENDLPDNYLK